MKSLHFFEYSDEINVSGNLKNHYFVAIHPSAQAKLQDLGLNYLTTKDFFNIEGHNSVCSKSHEIFENTNNYFFFEDENKIKEAYKRTLNFHFRYYLNYLLSITYIIDKSIKLVNPKKIYISKSTNIDEIKTSLDFKDRIAGYLVKKLVKSNNLDIEIIENAFVKKIEKKRRSNNVLKKIVLKFGNIFYKIVSSYCYN